MVTAKEPKGVLTANWAINILLTVVLGVVAWNVRGFAESNKELAKQIAELKTHVAVMNGNRFTSSDGFNLMTAHQKDISSIEIRLKSLEEAEIPPRWFEERVNMLEKRLHDLDGKVAAGGKK